MARVQKDTKVRYIIDLTEEEATALIDHFNGHEKFDEDLLSLYKNLKDELDA